MKGSEGQSKTMPFLFALTVPDLGCQAKVQAVRLSLQVPSPSCTVKALQPQVLLVLETQLALFLKLAQVLV